MTTHLLLNNFTVVVPEKQKTEYENVVGKERVVTHPDTLLGLTRKLQWMLDNLMDEECIVSLDDDVQKVLVMYEDRNRYVTDAEVVEEIIYQTYTTARDVGAKIFGWQILAQNIKYYTGFEPFNLTGFIHGLFGITADHNLFFNPEITVNQDSWLTLLNAYKNRYGLKDNRFAFIAKCFEGEGGLAGFRNVQTQDEDFKVLRKYFGNAITQNKKYKEEGGGLVPLKIKLPY